jgi:hypothetical protein
LIAGKLHQTARLFRAIEAILEVSDDGRCCSIRMESPMRLVIISALLLSMPVMALAQKTYTPSQLRAMVKSGKYPPQGQANSESKNMDYASCVSLVERTVRGVTPEYPASTIVSTNLMRVEKIWSNDAAVTITCSAPDSKMTMTSARYR